MAIARRLMPFGVKRLLYSGRTVKPDAAEVNGEFGKYLKGNSERVILDNMRMMSA